MPMNKLIRMQNQTTNITLSFCFFFFEKIIMKTCDLFDCLYVNVEKSDHVHLLAEKAKRKKNFPKAFGIGLFGCSYKYISIPILFAV